MDTSNSHAAQTLNQDCNFPGRRCRELERRTDFWKLFVARRLQSVPADSSYVPIVVPNAAPAPTQAQASAPASSPIPNPDPPALAPAAVPARPWHRPRLRPRTQSWSRSPSWPRLQTRQCPARRRQTVNQPRLKNFFATWTAAATWRQTPSAYLTDGEPTGRLAD